MDEIMLFAQSAATPSALDPVSVITGAGGISVLLGTALVYVNKKWQDTLVKYEALLLQVRAEDQKTTERVLTALYDTASSNRTTAESIDQVRHTVNTMIGSISAHNTRRSDG